MISTRKFWENSMNISFPNVMSYTKEQGFIRSLHELAENCDFGNKAEQIRDRVVIGIRDKELSEKLQLLPDLTLDKACEMTRNSELVKTQVKNLQSKKEKRSTEVCSKFKSPETRQVQERLVSTLEHMQVPKWDRTRCPEE